MEKAKQSRCISGAEQQYTEARWLTEKSIFSQWRLNHVNQGSASASFWELEGKVLLKPTFGLQVAALFALCVFP